MKQKIRIQKQHLFLQTNRRFAYSFANMLEVAFFYCLSLIQLKAVNKQYEVQCMIEKTSAIHYQTFTQSERIKITLYSLGIILSLAFVLLCLCAWCTVDLCKLFSNSRFSIEFNGKNSHAFPHILYPSFGLVLNFCIIVSMFIRLDIPWKSTD